MTQILPIRAARAGMEAATHPSSKGQLMIVHDLLVFLYALTGGLTLSGIVANVYRLLTPKKADSNAGKSAYFIVMVVAGPSVLIDNAARSWRTKACSTFAFWLAAALSTYWSFIIGLFALNIVLAL
jgi:hypothetical protein